MRNFLNETITMEKFCIEVLKGKDPKYQNIDHVSLENPQSDFDIGDVKLNIRIDIKYASPTMTNRKKRLPLWDFDLRKGAKKEIRRTYLTYYLCVGLKHNTPKVVFMIPYNEAPKSHLRISTFGNSKWNKYIIWKG